MALVLSAEEREQIEELIRVNVFQPIEPDRLSRRLGSVGVFCVDPERFPRWYKWENALQIKSGQRTKPRVSPVTNPGGSFKLSPTCAKIRKEYVNSRLIADILRSREILIKIADSEDLEDQPPEPEINPCDHRPCLEAHDWGLSVFQQMDLLYEGITLLRRIVTPAMVKPEYMVEYPAPQPGLPPRDRTYFISIRNWEVLRYKYL